MKVVRKISRSIFVWGTMCVSLVNVSCNQYGNELSPQLTLSSYSGRELFKGILIGDGPVADLIPVVKENLRIADFIQTEGDLGKGRQMIETLLDKLEQDSTNMFDEFKRKMASGDHLVVRNALPEYAMLMLVATDELYGDNIPSLLMEGKGKGLAKLINSAVDKSMTPSDVKRVLADPKFQQDVQSFFRDFDINAGGRMSATERQQCVFWVAALVIAVIYIAVVLEAAAAWTDVTVSWDDGVVTMSSSGEGRRTTSSSLMKEELVDSIVNGFR